MCKCTPEIRAMYCGKIGCELPKPDGTRDNLERIKPGTTWQESDLKSALDKISGIQNGRDIKDINCDGDSDDLRQLKIALNKFGLIGHYGKYLVNGKVIEYCPNDDQGNEGEIK